LVPRIYNRDAMRILAGCLLVAAGSVFLALSSSELHNKYGDPDLERFAVRPGISLTVEYGADHLACQMVIEPPQSLIHQEGQTRLMSSEAVSEVLEEVAPVAMRGNVISRSSFQSSCAVGYITEYENVSIMRGMSECKSTSPDHDSRTQIIFKRDICPKTRDTLGAVQPNSR
jgi:hypothetical protein